MFVPNFISMRCNYLEISDENRHLLRSGYEARTEQELPVLVRWFDKADVEAPEASFLDVILYSREQICEENASMGREAPPYEAPWGIISLKPQTVGHELPMNPITMMRNALGKEEGGSGVPLDRDQYGESVAFWEKHALIR